MADVAIRIPDDAVPYLSMLANLNDASRDDLLAAVEELDVAPANAFSKVVDGYLTFEADLNSREFAKSILGLAVVGVDRSYSSRDLAAAVAESDELDLADDARQSLQESLTRLLGYESLRIFAKALDLLRESDRLATDFRVVTELRPVFDVDADRPTGSLISHSLRLTYLEDGKMRNFSTALDLDDLEKLSLIIDRAKAKHVALRDWALGAGLIDLNSALDESGDE